MDEIIAECITFHFIPLLSYIGIAYLCRIRNENGMGVEDYVLGHCWNFGALLYYGITNE